MTTKEKGNCDKLTNYAGFIAVYKYTCHALKFLKALWKYDVVHSDGHTSTMLSKWSPFSVEIIG